MSYATHPAHRTSLGSPPSSRVAALSTNCDVHRYAVATLSYPHLVCDQLLSHRIRLATSCRRLQCPLSLALAHRIAIVAAIVAAKQARVGKGKSTTVLHCCWGASATKQDVHAAAPAQRLGARQGAGEPALHRPVGANVPVLSQAHDYKTIFSTVMHRW